jgi:hypothetical protein
VASAPSTSGKRRRKKKWPSSASNWARQRSSAAASARVLHGHEAVLLAVPEVDLAPYLADVEAPTGARDRGGERR